jgi:hypothetical protein
MSTIVSPITNHANKTTSHRTGWARMWKNCLDSKLSFNSDWSKETVVYFENGMEFNENSKGVNVFLKEPKSWDKLAEKAKMIESFEGELFSLDIDCPDYGARLRSRVREHSTENYKSLDFDKISKVCSRAKTIRQQDLKRKGLVLGDSHALSAWRADAYLCRNDGLTLNGAIKRGFDEWTNEYSDLEFLRTYFGNIDIRHHVCRLATTPNDQNNLVLDLVNRYIDELKSWQDRNKVSTIEVVASLPIENESRKLPKTGYFKSQPFWGSWHERDAAHQLFDDKLRSACDANGFVFVEWPKHFINEEGELDFSFMEKPRSVHISPEHYMWEI